ncbi:hypothetical protein PsorP6_000662 [Peronosclerospora sorghi]|uniref:Uncharacterized protein n=1 Tax=Peronosclerospora sorghi TaxID=230839 RepID=A0ACC0WV21_9STRA|nr:hypothetical protein PsorP6_000662 [Peronosclerospora sorghi]
MKKMIHLCKHRVSSELVDGSWRVAALQIETRTEDRADPFCEENVICLLEPIRNAHIAMAFSTVFQLLALAHAAKQPPRERRAQVIVEYAQCHLNPRHALVRALTREDLPHHDAERKHVRFFRILAVAKYLGSVTH